MNPRKSNSESSPNRSRRPLRPRLRESLEVEPFTVHVPWVTVRIQIPKEQAEFFFSFPQSIQDALGDRVSGGSLRVMLALEARQEGKHLCAGSLAQLAQAQRLVEGWGAPPAMNTGAPFELTMEERKWRNIEWTAAAMGFSSAALVRGILKDSEEGLISFRERNNGGKEEQ